jgi:hypothetical protein
MEAEIERIERLMADFEALRKKSDKLHAKVSSGKQSRFQTPGHLPEVGAVPQEEEPPADAGDDAVEALAARADAAWRAEADELAARPAGQLARAHSAAARAQARVTGTPRLLALKAATHGAFVSGARGTAAVRGVMPVAPRAYAAFVAAALAAADYSPALHALLRAAVTGRGSSVRSEAQSPSRSEAQPSSVGGVLGAGPAGRAGGGAPPAAAVRGRLEASLGVLGPAAADTFAALFGRLPRDGDGGRWGGAEGRSHQGRRAPPPPSPGSGTVPASRP